jgi:hypothetical protein
MSTWETAAERRHVIREHRTVDGSALAFSACGSILSQTAYDARMPDPPECAVCRMLYPARPAPG